MRRSPKACLGVSHVTDFVLRDDGKKVEVSVPVQANDIKEGMKVRIYKLDVDGEWEYRIDVF